MFNFDNRTNYYIDIIFYDNSCVGLRRLNIFVNNLTCENTLPNFYVRNPFQLGVIPYLSRIHFNILDNITQTFGCTGIYSRPFISIYSVFTRRIRQHGQSQIDSGFGNFMMYNIFSGLILVVYLVITILVVYELKKVNKQICELLKFLNYRGSSKKKNRQKEMAKKGNKIKGSGSLKSL